MDKKGQFQMGMIRVVIVALLILAIVAIVMFLVITNLRDTFESAEASQTGSFSNSTLSSLTQTGQSLTDGTISINNLRNCVATITAVTNATSGLGTGIGNVSSQNTTMSVGNYTINQCAFSATEDAELNNSAWNVTGTYTYNTADAANIVANITEGSTNFFKQIPTVFTLLGVVLIILVVLLVILAVSRFTTGGISLGAGGKGVDAL